VKRALRVYYMAGPGDTLASFEHWRAGRDHPEVTHVTYSSQLFDVCRELGAEAWAVGTHPRPGRASEGGITVEHRGDPLAAKSGAAYHAAHLAWARELARDARRFAPEVFVWNGEPYPFLLRPLRRLGARVVACHHNVLWPKLGAPRAVRRATLRLSRGFYRGWSEALLSASADVSEQLEQVAGGRSRPLVEFLPLFRAEVFRGIPPPDPAARPFRVLFAGRVERDKGVFDLLEVARRLHAAGRTGVAFDLCGSGSALEALRRDAEAAGVAERFHTHGWCDQARLRELLGRAHLVVVPTTSSFLEGFNQVVVEALLAGRPALTSEVCPATRYVEGAVALVPADDPGAYLRAICELADSPERYLALQRACEPVSRRFLDERTSFRAALRHVLGAIASGREPTPIRFDPRTSEAPR
jgi:glycosyltransferase involved in cell wall biosynthesis